MQNEDCDRYQNRCNDKLRSVQVELERFSPGLPMHDASRPSSHSRALKSQTKSGAAMGAIP